jgi:hypothetical protein
MITNMKKIPLIFLLCSHAVFAQTGSPKELIAQLDSYESRYRQAGAASEILSRQADSLAKVIQKRKSNNSRNILSDRALAEELRLSQELAGKLQAAQHLEEAQLDSLIRKAEQTLKILNGEVTRLTIQFSAAKANGNPDQQKLFAAELRDVEKFRQRCQTLLKNTPAPAPLMQVMIQPDDSPEEIAQKADFVLDQSDRLRRNAQETEEKTKHVRQELAMRERLADFVQDLRVFDPSPEATQGAPKSVGFSATPESDVSSELRDRAGTQPISSLLLANDTVWPQDISQLSNADLKKWIAHLENQRKYWLAQADSLVKRALDMRNSINSKTKER